LNQISITYRIISLTMAFLIFLSSAGFSMDMHFCGANLKSFSLTGKAKNCFELAKTKTCPKHKKAIAAVEVECEMSKKDCCHNQTVHFQADLTPDIPANDFLISASLQDFVIAFVTVYGEKPSFEPVVPNFIYYKPPLIPKDIPVLIQSFLL